ncbi:MAG: DNA-3-methyladenine glycosylase family protein [Solirubrobacterales bacterium]
MPDPSVGPQSTALDPAPAAARRLAASDPVLAAIIERVGPLDPRHLRRGRPTSAFGSLARSVVGQQLSTVAARTIWERVVAIIGEPGPTAMLDADPADLRDAGLSQRKVAYLRGLAELVVDGELDLDALAELPDDEVTAQLTAVRGFGVWTAEMFLIFHLGRPDVLPVGDLGIRRAAERAYELDALPEPGPLRQLAEPWRPQRSLASLYLWRSLDATPA